MSRSNEAIALMATPATFAQAFSRGTWRPAKHLLVLALALADLAFGQRKRLIVEMPPRHGKSELVSFWFLVWFLILFPHKRVILASYEADFAATWGRRVRNAVDEYGKAFSVQTVDGGPFAEPEVEGDSSAAHRWGTNHGGGMFTTGVGGPMTGKGADILVVDDPVKNDEEAQSEAYRRRNIDWWRTTARTRLQPGASVVIVQTRWHQEDLAGILLKESAEGGEHYDELKLPAVAEENDPLGRKPGEALWPEQYDRTALDTILAGVKERVFAALFQQRPSPAEGNIFKRAWFLKRWKALPSDITEFVQSWDCAFKETTSSDFVCGQIWGKRAAERWLVDQVHGRMDFPTTCQAIRDLSAKHPRARLKLVEDKANGPAVIQTLSRAVPGLVAVNPQGGKEARAHAVAPFWEAGNVWIPDSSVASWVSAFVEECADFPNAPNDDRVDAMTQALIRMAEMVPATTFVHRV